MGISFDFRNNSYWSANHTPIIKYPMLIIDSQIQSNSFSDDSISEANDIIKGDDRNLQYPTCIESPHSNMTDSNPIQVHVESHDSSNDQHRADVSVATPHNSSHTLFSLSIPGYESDLLNLYTEYSDVFSDTPGCSDLIPQDQYRRPRSRAHPTVSSFTSKTTHVEPAD